MYNATIWHGPNFDIKGNITGRTVKEVRRKFVEWKEDHGIAKNNGDYFLTWR